MESKKDWALEWQLVQHYNFFFSFSSLFLQILWKQTEIRVLWFYAEFLCCVAGGFGSVPLRGWCQRGKWQNLRTQDEHKLMAYPRKTTSLALVCLVCHFVILFVPNTTRKLGKDFVALKKLIYNTQIWIMFHNYIIVKLLFHLFIYRWYVNCCVIYKLKKCFTFAA